MHKQSCSQFTFYAALMYFLTLHCSDLGIENYEKSKFGRFKIEKKFTEQ